MNNLFELNSAIKTVQEKDIDPDLLKDTLDSLELARNEKLDNIATWIESNNAKLDWLDTKLKQLREVKKHLTNQNNNLMNYLTEAIVDSGYKSLKTDNHMLKLRNYKASTIVEDTQKLPIDYVKREEVVKPDREKIYKDLSAGKKITGAHLKENRKTVIQ